MGDWNAINSQVPYQLQGGDGGGGDCNCDGANVGDGPGKVFRNKTGNTLNFRSIKSDGGTVTVTVDGDNVNLEAVAPPPTPTNLQQAYDASGTDDPQIQLSDANGPVKVYTNGTSLDAALSLQKGIQYGDDFNTAPNFRIFCINTGGFAGKNNGVSVEGQDNSEDDASAAGGDVINKAGSNTSGGAAGLGGNVIHQAGTGPTNNGSVDSKVGDTLSLRTTGFENRSFFDFVLESPGSDTRDLTYFAAGSVTAWRFNIDTAVGGAASFNTSWPGKPTRDAGTKFQVGDIIQIRQDDAGNAITEWAPFGQVRQNKAAYANVSFDTWNGGNWVLPKDNATAVVVPDQLETTLALGNDFTVEAGGNGGRIVYGGEDPKIFRISFNFTVIRPPQISLDARGQFFIGQKPSGAPDFVQNDGSGQWHRFNIIDCDDVLNVEALLEVSNGDAIALMGTSDAGAASDGLGIQLKGYTLVVTEV